MSALPIGRQPSVPAGFGAVLAQVAGGQPLLPPFYPQGTPIVPPAGAEMPEMSPAPSGMPPMPKMSKGQMILGILGDALAGAAGGGPVFGKMMQQRRQKEDERAEWGLKRQAEREDKQWEWKNKPQDPSPMERDALAWSRMTPELQAAYRAAQAAKPQFIPDGLGGGQWVQPPQPGARPAGPPSGVTFTPLPNGGPAPAPGNFPRR